MKKLLIANRGEIARRVIRTAHRMGLQTVAVYSDADAQSLHVSEAGTAVALGGNTSAESYLRVDKLLAAARATGADAIHPGYGFLSENADFAQAVADAGLTWVGPPAAAIRALGSKSAAKQLAQQQGVPCLPGYQGDDQSDERFVAEAARVGYPLMVKATAGGGGRGMRLVLDAAGLPAALASARSEAISSFGSGELLIERALLRPRHVELQVFADQHGHCVHLGERDCSVQRRHQKIVEESPSPALNDALRERMGRCAVALALGAGYQGAGTVEFLMDGEGEDFFLMEMNTRLQVEHPVTEALTGLDLVEWQLRVARGEPLPLAQEQLRFQGHAIEVRLCAEEEDYVPQAGQVLEFAAPEGVRCDHALTRASVVPPYYDSMLGKIIAHGANRSEAIDRLIAALRETRVLGLQTNRAFLIECLDHAGFRAGQALVPFLAEQGDQVRAALQARERELLAHACLAACFAGTPGAAATLAAPYERHLRFSHRGQVLDFTLTETGQRRVRLQWNGESLEASVSAAADGLDVSLQGRCLRVHAQRTAQGRWHVQADGVELWLDELNFEPVLAGGGGARAAEVRAAFNGKLLAVRVKPGDAVARGDALLVIESMKLEHAVSAPRDAVVAQVLVEAGQQVMPGQVLVRFEP